MNKTFVAIAIVTGAMAINLKVPVLSVHLEKVEKAAEKSAVRKVQAQIDREISDAAAKSKPATLTKDATDLKTLEKVMDKVGANEMPAKATAELKKPKKVVKMSALKPNFKTAVKKHSPSGASGLLVGASIITVASMIF